MVTLIVLVTVKYCSNVALCIDNQHHGAIFVSASGGKMDQLDHLEPQINVESHFSVDFYSLILFEALYTLY